MSDLVVVTWGNTNPQMQVPQEEGPDISIAAPHLNQSVTTVQYPEPFADPEEVAHTLSTDNDRMLSLIARTLSSENQRYAVAIYEMEQIVGVHSAGVKPLWVNASEETDAAFLAALAEHFGCTQGEPTNVLTEKGRDALHEQHLKSSQPAAFHWGALSPSKTTVKESETELPEEVKTSEGGLIRAEMTFAHTAGTNTSTLTHTWTANSHDSLPVTLAKFANFNASSSGTVGEMDLLSAEATIQASGDSLTATFTLKAG